MQSKILLFWLAVWIGLFLLKLFPGSATSQLAFTWFGPSARFDEKRAHFQVRWAGYSFWWFTQIAVAFCLIAVVADYRDAQDAVWFQVSMFALGLGGAAAALATLWFLLVALKARTIGPNPSLQRLPPDQ
jgi:hypothetical protein